MTTKELKSEIQKTLDNVSETILQDILVYLREIESQPKKGIDIFTRRRSKKPRLYLKAWFQTINRVDQLENFPKSGRSVPEFNSEIMKELIEGNYRVFYKINPDHIGVVRIHHSARQ